MGAEGGDSSESKPSSERVESVSINIRCSNATTFVVRTSLESTVGDFKGLLAENCDVPADQQRLIYKGRILKDDQTLESYGLKADHTVHMVQGFSPASSNPPPAPAVDAGSGTGANDGTPLGGLGSPLFLALGFNPLGGGGGGASNLFGAGLPEFEQVQQQLTQNPNMMREMMNMLAIQNLMNNPELMRTLIMSNRQMRDIIDRNPELADILNDPGILGQTAEAARSPDEIQQNFSSSDSTPPSSPRHRSLVGVFPPQEPSPSVLTALDPILAAVTKDDTPSTSETPADIPIAGPSQEQVMTDINLQLDQVLSAEWEDPLESVNLQGILTLPAQPASGTLTEADVLAAKDTLRTLFGMELSMVSDEMIAAVSGAVDVLLKSDLSATHKFSLRALKNRVTVLHRDFTAAFLEKEKKAAEMNNFKALNASYEEQKKGIQALTADIQHQKTLLDGKLADVEGWKREIKALQSKIHTVESEIAEDLKNLSQFSQRLQQERSAATSEGRRLNDLLPGISFCHKQLAEIEDIIQGHLVQWDAEVKDASYPFV